MSATVFSKTSPLELFTHFLLYGAATIASSAAKEVTLSWTGGMAPQPTLTGLEVRGLAELVHVHAQVRAMAGSWLAADLPHESGRALFSPRVKGLPDAAWDAHQAARHVWLDTLASNDAREDLRLIGALGEPSYWHRDRLNKPLQDDGASRLDMQPRNQGSEFVGTRLRALAAAVAARSVEAVEEGLSGAVVRDELRRRKAFSTTATNLRPTGGPTDAARAWVALWGLAQTAVAHRIATRSQTATHSGARPGCFVVPVWNGQWTPARLRSVLSSDALASVAAAAASDGEPAALTQATSWLRARSVPALVVFPVGVFGSAKAPERRALGGRLVRLGA